MYSALATSLGKELKTGGRLRQASVFNVVKVYDDI